MPEDIPVDGCECTVCQQERSRTSGRMQWECAYCYSVRDTEPVTVHSRNYCEGCVQALGGEVECDRCEGRTLATLARQVRDGNVPFSDQDQERWCRECARYCHSCSYCGNRFIEDTLEELDGAGPLCLDCREHFVFCDNCENHFHESIIEDEYRHQCARGPVLNYSYRPQFVFHDRDAKTGGERRDTEQRTLAYFDDRGNIVVPEPPAYGRRLYMGAEIEVELDGSQNRREVAESFLSKVDEQVRPEPGADTGFIYLKEDSSIGFGFEAVTHPFTWDWAKEHFPFSAFTWLKDQGHSAETEYDHTGLHVHVARSAFTRSHLWRFIYLHERNTDEVSALARRSHLRYMHWGEAKEAAVLHGGRGYGRDPINLLNDTTIELRYCNGTLDASVLRATFQWVDAAYNYTKMVNTAEAKAKGMLSWNRFCDWTTNGVADRYPELNEYLGRQEVLYSLAD